MGKIPVFPERLPKEATPRLSHGGMRQARGRGTGVGPPTSAAPQGAGAGPPRAADLLAPTVSVLLTAGPPQTRLETPYAAGHFEGSQAVYFGLWLK